MTRILAPLLVVILAAILTGAAAVHLAGELGQKKARTRAGLETEFHRAMIRPDLRPALLARVDAYLAESGGDAEARWFAAERLLQLTEIDRAIDSVFQDEQVAADPASARRFAEAVLRAVGFEDPQRLERPALAAMACLLALADGQVPEALEQIDRIARELATQAFLSIFEGAFAFTTEATSEHVAAALRARGLETTEVVAALATLNEAPYPERDDDIERLSKVLAGNLRRREPLVWALAALALGRSEDARAIEALTRAAGNEAGGTDIDRFDQAIATTGLVAAGHWEGADALTPYLGPLARKAPVRRWYAEALLNRLRRGDPEAPARFREVWASLRIHPEPYLMAQVAQGLLLRDLAIPTSLDVDAILADLEREATHLPERAVAAAYRYRRGEPGAREALLALLREVAQAGWTEKDPVRQSALIPSPLVVATRALLVYEP